MDPVTLRLIERLTAVIIGGIAIYLGYRLFLTIPNERNAEGELKLPGDISIYLSRVGPGVFFAVFGSLVVAASLYFGISVERPAESFSGLGEAVVRERSDPSDVLRTDVRQHLVFLNRVRPVLREAFGKEQAPLVDRELSAIKFELMERVWDDEWGDAAMFEGWVRYGVAPPDTSIFGRARAFYNSGDDFGSEAASGGEQ